MRQFVAILVLFCMIVSVSAQDFATVEELADPNGQFTDVDGVRLYYIAEGDTDNPAVIFLHGFGGSTWTWRDNLPVIADAGYYAVAVDLPPFGLSDKSEGVGYSSSDMATHVVSLMDALDIETATIVGHSMGGTVTAYFAVNYPERVEKLVFVAGGLFTASGAALDGDGAEQSGSPFEFLANIDPTSPAAVGLIRATVRPTTFVNLLSDAYYDASVLTEEVAEGYQRPLLLEDWASGFLYYLQAEETQRITLDDLANAIDVPVLYIWGEADTWVSVTVGEAMDEVIENDQFVRYEAVGHLPMEENTAQFNSDLIAFLGGES